MHFRPVARCLALAHHCRDPWSRSFASSSSSLFGSVGIRYMAMAGLNPSRDASPRPDHDDGVTLADLPKSWHFTASLPPDPLFPTPADSHKATREELGPRQVRGALFTWVRPEPQQDPELLAVSPAAMRDLGLALSEADTDDFRQTVVGNKLHGWDPETLSGPGYPWAQCYGGFQFGDWAGQLGDGRAISLFEATNPRTGRRYEVQLKGAGLTPYSRFADGKAVLRSSIREFVVSEALNALGIPTTRALAISLLPHSRVRRERIEPGAIVVRLAESWLRLGTFDLLRARRERALTRRLATYLAEDVLGGWHALPARIDNPSDQAQALSPPRGIAPETLQGPSGTEENRFARLYREVVRRNAATVARWQVYGFMNGVLNTDNTSVLGLSLDFGPFAFMDTFDPAYTPNHDDALLRYSYRNQPTIIWWNLVRFGEALAELFGAGPDVDTDDFVAAGPTEATAPPIIARAEDVINRAGDEYKSVFLSEYKRLFALRLGFRPESPLPADVFDVLISPLLDVLTDLELDFHRFFRRLSTVPLADLAEEDSRLQVASRFLDDSDDSLALRNDDKARRERLADWLALWRERVVADWSGGESPDADATSIIPPEVDAERIKAMKRVNPNFVPRGWILDEVIRRVEHEGERDVLKRLLHLALHPFEDSWAGREFDGILYEGDRDEEVRWTGSVPRTKRAMQCSCSS
ncbi:hypothetical protein VTJ83DRAFT_6653 [Remersonia thermophila]|uniref:Selenoprotein O n=1 Tax=Remersonia thermophila TaxID=72144 RepID=A0ABR4D5B5_9PEZI